MSPTRSERLVALAVASVAAAFAAVLATGAADYLGGLPWFANGSNVIQWVSGPATFAAVAGAVYAYWARRCAAPWCVRHGEHPVRGTLRKVCAHHHTLHHHELVHDLEHEAHEWRGRLGWGESHLRGTAVVPVRGRSTRARGASTIPTTKEKKR